MKILTTSILVLLILVVIVSARVSILGPPDQSTIDDFNNNLAGAEEWPSIGGKQVVTGDIVEGAQMDGSRLVMGETGTKVTVAGGYLQDKNAKVNVVSSNGQNFYGISGTTIEFKNGESIYVPEGELIYFDDFGRISDKFGNIVGDVIPSKVTPLQIERIGEGYKLSKDTKGTIEFFPPITVSTNNGDITGTELFYFPDSGLIRGSDIEINNAKMGSGVYSIKENYLSPSGSTKAGPASSVQIGGVTVPGGNLFESPRVYLEESPHEFELSEAQNEMRIYTGGSRVTVHGTHPTGSLISVSNTYSRNGVEVTDTFKTRGVKGVGFHIPKNQPMVTDKINIRDFITSHSRPEEAPGALLISVDDPTDSRMYKANWVPSGSPEYISRPQPHIHNHFDDFNSDYDLAPGVRPRTTEIDHSTRNRQRINEVKTPESGSHIKDLAEAINRALRSRQDFNEWSE